MAVDLGNLSIGVVPQLAALDALELRLAALDRGQYAAHIGVDTSAVAAAEQRVTSLGSAHQQLGARPVALGMDVSQIESARTSVKNLDNDLLSLAGSAGKIAPALAAVAVGGALTKFASDYQQTLVTTSNQTTLTTADIATMDKTIRELPTGSASLQSVATAFKNVSDLGYSAADATKILRETSKAATETGADQATVALAITSAMKEYNASADEAGKYTNIVAQAAKEANSSLQAWTEGTRTGVAVAAAYGVSLQEADAFMVALTRHGFDAAEASTQLRGVIQHIVNPDEKAQAALKEVTKATGINLVSDFSDEGLKARTFAGVMQDLQTVIEKTGDESIVTRLIPALRGGQGALITVTQAAQDAKTALTDLNAAADGALKPVDEGFDRISKTTGYQFSATMKQLKLDLIDVGQAGLPPITMLAEAVGKVPAPVIEGAVRFGELLLVLKSVAVAGDLVSGVWEKITASTAASTAATATAAASEASAATETAALTAALTANTEATIANTAARAENVVSADAMLASIPGFTLALADEDAALAGNTALTNENTAAKERNATAGAGAGAAKAGGGVLAGLLGGAGPLVAIAEALNVFPKVAGDILDWDPKQAIGDFLRNMPGTPWGLAATVGNMFGKNIYQGLYDLTGIGFGGNTTPTAAPPALGGDKGILPGGFSPYDQPGMSATGPRGIGLPSQQQQKELDQQAKDFAKSQADYFKQLDKDVADAKTKAQKDAVDQAKADLQAQGDYAVALATKVSDAWKQAGQAVASVDPSKGIQGLIDAAPGLDKARDALTALGQHDGALDRLTALADVFHSWAADTDKANAALRGYDLTLTETNKAIQGIGALKSEYLAALDAAEKRQVAGTADASDIAIINARATALTTLDQQTSRLQQQGNLDILGKLGNLPDFAALNQNLRNVVASQGGGAAVLASLTAGKAQASQDITQFERTWHDSIDKIKSDTNDAKKAVDAFLVGLPTDKTITIHYAQDAPGSTSTAQGNEGTGYPVSAGGPTMTPRGDATNLIPYADLINQAAQAYGVPAWVLGAIIEHESGGTVGAVQPGGLGRGLTQVDIGQNPQYDESRLRGTSREDAAYQINSGAEIFANFLKQFGGDFPKALQNYAGSAYRSQAGGGVPSGLDLPTELTNYYKPQVQAALAAADPTRGYGGGGSVTAVEHVSDLAGSAAQGIAPSSVLAAAKQHLGQATVVVDGVTTAVFGWCEKIADDILQQATGINTRFYTADDHIRAAMANNPGAGTVIDASQARAGDLVGWLGTGTPGGSEWANDPRGHIGVYSGNGRYIGTTPQGVQERTLGPGAIFIRPDGVVASGPEPGSVVYTAAAGTPAGGDGSGAHVPAGSAGAHALSGAAGSVQQATVSAGELQTALQAVNVEFAKMDAPSIKGAKDSLAGMIPVLTEIAGKALFGANGPLTDTERQEAAAAAWQKGLNYEKDFAVVVQGIEDRTISLDAATKTLAADIGGPMADAYAKAAVASAQMAAADSAIAKLQADQKAADTDHQAALKVIQGGTDALAAAHQTVTDRIAAETTAENRKYQVIQEGEQDRQRALQFSQQLQATDLQNSLVDVQTRQQRAGYTRTAQEQVTAEAAAGAGSNQQGGVLSAQLAAMRERDLKQKDADTQAIDAIQTKIRLQQRAAALDSYNLETETIRASRAHEGRINQIAAETTAENLRYQRGQADIKAATDAENEKYQHERDANQQAIDAQNTIKTAAQANLDLAQQALDIWKQTGQVVSVAGQNLASAVSGAQSFLNGQSLANFPRTGAIRTLGGHWAGGFGPVGSEFNVGDGPGGTVTPYTERVRVTPAGVTVTPLATRPASEGGAMTVNLNLGDLNLMLSDADKADIRAYVAAKVAAVRKAGRTQTRATGNN